MARAIKLRKAAYEVYLDEVMEEVKVLVDKDDPNSEMVTKMKHSDPADPGSPMVPTMELQLRAVEVEEGKPQEGTLFQLSSMPLQAALNAGKLARKGEPGEAAYQALQTGLTGWTGLSDASGAEVEFDKSLIEFLSMDEAMALAAFVMEKVAGKTIKSRRMVGNA